MNLVAYIRVSTDKQKQSGLGLEAQQEYINRYAQQHGATVLAEYQEAETAKHANRPKLQQALRHAQVTGSVLAMATLDRMSRKLLFIATLLESGVKFICCDFPDADTTMIQMRAVFAEWELRKISQRTKDAMRVFKAKKIVPKRIRKFYADQGLPVPPEIVAATAGKLGGQLPQCRNLTMEARRRGAKRAGETAKRKAAERRALREAVAG